MGKADMMNDNLGRTFILSTSALPIETSAKKIISLCHLSLSSVNLGHSVQILEIGAMIMIPEYLNPSSFHSFLYIFCVCISHIICG